MSKIKFRWDVIVVLAIGTSLTLLVLFLTYQDITFLLTKKELTSAIKKFNDQTYRIDIEYEINNKNYYSSKYKLGEEKYKAIRSNPDAKLFYNPQFPEQVHFDNETSVSWGGVLLMTFGIFIIVSMTKYSVTTLSK